MVKTALDDLPTRLQPSCWDGGFWTRSRGKARSRSASGKREFCHAGGFVQGGFLSAMLDSSMAAAPIVMSEGKLYSSTVSITVNCVNLKMERMRVDLPAPFEPRMQ